MPDYHTLNASSAPAVAALMSGALAPRGPASMQSEGLPDEMLNGTFQGMVRCRVKLGILECTIGDKKFTIPTTGSQVVYRVRGRAVEFDYDSGTLRGAWRRIEFGS